MSDIYSSPDVVNPETITACTGFDWDEANVGKLVRRHKVSAQECEEAFRNILFGLGDDLKHSSKEARHQTLGRTDAGRILFLAFTIRDLQIRVISARNASRRERKEYRLP